MASINLEFWFWTNVNFSSHGIFHIIVKLIVGFSSDLEITVHIWITCSILRTAQNEMCKRRNIPCTGLDRPWGFQEFQAVRFPDSWHMKVVRLSALRTRRINPPPPRDIPGTHFSYRLSRPHGRKDYVNEKFEWNHWESNLRPPVCSAVPQPTTPRVKYILSTIFNHEEQ
jgi:hypothetical protein